MNLTNYQGYSYKAIQPHSSADSAVAASAVAADESATATATGEPEKFPYEAQKTAERIVDTAAKHGMKLVDDDQRERQIMRMAGEVVRGRHVAEQFVTDMKADGITPGYKQSWSKLRSYLQMLIDAAVEGDDKAKATAAWRVCRGWYDPPVAGLDIPPDGDTAYSIDDRELAASCQKAGWSVVGLDVEAPTQTANNITFHYLDGTQETHDFITFREAVELLHPGEIIEVFA